MADTRFSALVDEYREETWCLDLVEASSLGVHLFDPMLPTASREGIEERDRRFSNLLGRFQAIDASGLSTTQKLEHQVGLIDLKRERPRAMSVGPLSALVPGYDQRGRLWAHRS